jgi:DNA-directed RNA polymerase specialized sigma24 family protein
MGLEKRKNQFLVTVSLDKKQCREMISALHQLVKVLAAEQTKSMSSNAQKARFLRDAFGLSIREIGGILDMHHKSVQQALKKKRPTGRRPSKGSMDRIVVKET